MDFMAEDSARVVWRQLAASGAAHFGAGWRSAVAAGSNCGLVRKVRRAENAAPPIAGGFSGASHNGPYGGVTSRRGPAPPDSTSSVLLQGGADEARKRPTICRTSLNLQQ